MNRSQEVRVPRLRLCSCRLGAGRPSARLFRRARPAAIVFRRPMRRLGEQDRWPVAPIWPIACGFAADWAGLHFKVGAFLSGAVINADWFDQEKLDDRRHEK